MAQIPIYVDNNTYIEFLQKDDEERARIRKEAQQTIIDEVNANIDEDMDSETIIKKTKVIKK